MDFKYFEIFRRKEIFFKYLFRNIIRNNRDILFLIEIYSFNLFIIEYDIYFCLKF